MYASNAFLHSVAEHFTKSNVMLNIFLWKMYAEHFPKENVCKNAFLHQMHFCNASNAFVTFCVTKCDAKMHFCTASNAFVTFCFAEHFPWENVQQNKMYASLFFAKQKTQHFCTAEHFPKENVQQSKMLQIHFCKAKQRKAMQNGYTHVFYLNFIKSNL